VGGGTSACEDVKLTLLQGSSELIVLSEIASVETVFDYLLGRVRHIVI